MAPRLRAATPPAAEAEKVEETAASARPFGLSSFTWRLAKPTVSANDETPASVVAAESAAPSEEAMGELDEAPATSRPDPEDSGEETGEGEEPESADRDQGESDAQFSGAREKARRLRRRLREAARSRPPAGE
jgi:hypothetical protein